MDIHHLSEFELKQICYFMAVVQAGNSFTQAAKRLGTSQPPVSQRVQALEEKLSGSKPASEVKLFDRSTHPVALTEAGKVFLEEVQLALIHLERGIEQARRASQGQIGRLTVGVNNSIANTKLTKILQAFQKRFPQVELELRECTAVVQQELQLLKNHQLDVVFYRSPSIYPPNIDKEDSNLSFMPIFQEAFVVVLPETHAFINRPQIPLKALENESIILPSLDALPFYADVAALCRDAGFEPKIMQTIVATGIVTILSLVATGLGVSILPDHVQVLHRKGVVYRPIQDATLIRQHFLVWRQDDSSIVLRKFLDVVQEVMQLPLITA